LLTSKTEQIDSSTTVVTSYGYDTLTNHRAPITLSVDPAALALDTTVGYDGVGNVQTITDPEGHVRRFCFDLGRRLTRVISQIGTLDHSNCATTPAVAGDDPITDYVYDADSFLTTTSVRDYDPISTSGVWRDTDYTYTDTQWLETIKDPEGNVTGYDYDALGRTAMVTDPEGRKTRTFHFADGKVRKALRAYQFAATSTNEDCTYGTTDQQCYARYAYAPSGQDAADYNGQVYSIQDANGNTTTYSYDLYDRLYDTTFPDSSYERNAAS
jgi:YD repeat-containing protein